MLEGLVGGRGITSLALAVAGMGCDVSGAQDAAAPEDGCADACDGGPLGDGPGEATPNCEPGAPASLFTACAEQRRDCVAYAGGAECGACAAGSTEDPETGKCVASVTCDALDCARHGRVCEGARRPRCGACVEGLVADDGACRAPYACADLDCGESDCVEPPPGAPPADASCRPPCGDRTLWNGRECAPCPPCDDPAREAGREPRPTLAGACICRTRPGFFYSTANESGVVPCDADGDGWVRESARVVLESGDPALTENVRCDVRSVDRVVLHNEAGQTRAVPLDAPLPLFESVRNDDDAVLDIQWVRAQLPRAFWGAEGDGVRAAALNRFTKLCHHPRADYNDNGVGDPYEWGGAEPAPEIRPDQLPFNRFAYFLELHRGWYEADAWHIAERHRAAPGDGGVPLSYPADACPDDAACDGWRSCVRLRDADADRLVPPVGMDLALEPETLADGPDWTGMTHHSQFKCLVVRDAPDEAAPLERSPSAAAAEFRLNACRTSGAPEGGDVRLTCEPAAVPTPGSALWGAVPYRDYPPNDAHRGYVRGCTNGCAEALRAHLDAPDDLRCPGVPDNPPRCAADASAFGRLICLEAPCDGIDNDENGEVDEGGVGPGATCVAGDEPACCFTGLVGACNLGVARACEGVHPTCEAPEPAEEVCDGRDNDCDGEIDEALDGIPCAAANDALGLPEDPDLPGVCGDRLTRCVDGVYRCAPRHPYEPEGETLCDGHDNDCDGETDEGLDGLPVPGEAAAGALYGARCLPEQARLGVCADNAWRCRGAPVCAPRAVVVEREACTPDDLSCHWLCDGLDNDCDGLVDEDEVCLRRWVGSLRVTPVADSDHNLFNTFLPELAVDVDVDFDVTGTGTSQLEVTVRVEAAELLVYANEVQATGFAEETLVLEAGGVVKDIVGEQPIGSLALSLGYLDSDFTLDGLYPPGIRGGVFGAEPRLEVDSDSLAVRRLVCDGRGHGLIAREPGLPPWLQCDRYFCGDAFDACLADMVSPAGCARHRECALGCDPIEDPSDRASCHVRCNSELDQGGAARRNALQQCCHDHTPEDGEFEPTSCEVAFEVEYRLFAPPGRCEGPPSDEVCDGCDNDHDGDIDETFAGEGLACGTDVGVCEPGRAACVAGTETCVGGVQPAPDEGDACDGADDDCDGLVDDGVRTPCVTSCGWGTVACGVVPDEDGCLGGGCPDLCGHVGRRRCPDGAQVFGSCGYPDLPAEACNALDDDCDGEIDEDFPGVESPCGPEVGACESGALACLDGEVVCAGGVGPAEEVCDGVDNDCDGVVDGEGCPCEEGSPEGPCGVDIGACRPGLRRCLEGEWSACEGAVAPVDEVCDGVDNDCDGATDESFRDAGAPCGTEVGACVPGAWACEAGERVCAGSIGPADEVCDGTDNDCDGVVDFEGCPCAGDLEEPCGLNDVGECRLGARRCINDRWTGCGWAALPADEVCDGLDNDCDGRIDDAPLRSPPEAEGEIGAPCGTGAGVCEEGAFGCEGGVVLCVGSVEPTEEVCDGLDNDCDGVVDVEGCPCEGELEERCGGDDVGLCDPGTRRCRDGVLTGCEGVVGPTEEICDDEDNDCDGQIDENISCIDCHVVNDINGTGQNIELCTIVRRGGSATFWMGCRDDLNGDHRCLEVELPVHPVTFDYGFEVMRNEVTVAQYRACVAAGRCTPANTCVPGAGGPNYDIAGASNQPIVCVTWPQARAFAGWIGGRLPSNSEWEYAARGPMPGPDDYSIFPWGDETGCGFAAVTGCPGLSGPVDVGRYAPAGDSPFGVSGLGGNVAEWTEDCFNLSYAGAPANGAPRTDGCRVSDYGPPHGSMTDRDIRGGTWGLFPQHLIGRNSSRLPNGERLPNGIVGFRAAVTTQ